MRLLIFAHYSRPGDAIKDAPQRAPASWVHRGELRHAAGQMRSEVWHVRAVLSLWPVPHTVREYRLQAIKLRTRDIRSDVHHDARYGLSLASSLDSCLCAIECESFLCRDQRHAPSKPTCR